MHHHLDLPIHPTKRHPITGHPLRAIFVRADGRVFWPIMGAAEGDDADAEAAAAATAAKAAADAEAARTAAGAPSNAKDAQGNDLGYPDKTPVAEMSDKEQAAYYKYQGRKREERFKNVFGDRDPDEVKKDLDAYAELQKGQMTAAEQQLADAREEGKKEALTTERGKTATAIFRGALEAGGIAGDDLDELVTNLNVANFIGDDGVDTTKLTNFAKRFVTSDKDAKKERRDYGGGHRKDGQAERGSAGKAEAQRRFKKKTTTSE